MTTATATKIQPKGAQSPKNNHTDPVTFRRVRVTPEMASEWLKKNHSNRKINKQIVSRYARTLSEDGWRLNGDTIKFDNKDGLIDGQHRLTACVETGVSFDAFVVRGVDRDVFDTIDIGKGRTAGDALFASGRTTNSSLVASIANLAIKLNTNSLRLNRYIEPHTVRAWVEANASVEFAAERVMSMRFLGFGPVLGLTYFMAMRENPEKADQFFTQLTSGENLTKGDPAHTLRETLIKHKSDRGYHKADVLAMCLTAWRSFLSGKPLPVLKRNMALTKVGTTDAFMA